MMSECRSLMESSHAQYLEYSCIAPQEEQNIVVCTCRFTTLAFVFSGAANFCAFAGIFAVRALFHTIWRLT